MDPVKWLIETRRQYDFDDVDLIIQLSNGKVVHGQFFGFVSARENEPEIAETDIHEKRTGGHYGYLETEIESITVIPRKGG